MNKQIVLLSALLASLLVSFAARAAETTELQVKGSIRPPACIPSFADGGVVDFGVIKVADLKAGQYTTLPEKQVNFNVSCDQAAKIVLTVTDNRAASRVTDTFNSLDAAIHVFGLGSVDGKNVGGYRLTMLSETNLDGKTAIKYYRTASSGYQEAIILANNTGYSFAFSTDGSAQPSSGKLLNVAIKVETRLNKPANLNLTGDVPLDGSATFEIKYQ